MSFGITSLAGSALSGMNAVQQQLADEVDEASSGQVSLADDPSGVAIAASLNAQAAGFAQGAQNATDAQDALTVASGAMQSITSSLQQLRSLAVQASSDLLSTSERADLQTQANQLVAQIDTDAQSANYNGTPLLDGTYAGVPAAPASANLTTNAALSQGGTLVTEAVASPSSQGGTITLSAIDGGSGPGVNVNFTSTATGQTTYLGVQAPGSTVNVLGTQVTLGSVTAGDAGQTATIQVDPATVGSAAPQLAVQTAAPEGSTTGLSLFNSSAGALGITNVDLSSTASATNALGQIDEALNAVGSSNAIVGAQTDALQDAVTDDNTESTDLTASASNDGDANAAQLSTEIAKSQTQEEVSDAVLASTLAFESTVAGLIVDRAL
jgi:flagellin